MTAEQDAWVAAYAKALGQPAPAADEIAALLDLAGVAAHSAVRTAAPLSCWIAGRAGVSAAEALRLANEVAAGLGTAGGPES